MVNGNVETPPPKTQSRMLWIVTIVILILALLWGAYWLLYARFHMSTDDAYSNGNMVDIHTTVPGSVIAFFADDTDFVQEGQLLVKLDTTDYQLKYEQELASLASVVLQVRQIYDQVRVSRSTVKSRQIILERANYNYQNRADLVESQAVSNEEFTHSQDDLKTATTELKQAKEQLKVALAAAGNTTLEKHPLLEQQKAKVRTAFYNLQHCTITAPTTGYIAQRGVQVGEWVTPAKSLMAIIPLDYVWVDANFKETELTNMRVGQPAEVKFDLYGSGVKFEGKVLGIASGTGSVFSLLPPQNATGNWIKIVQRLAVRIGLDPEQVKQYPIRMGLSAEVNVNVSDTDLPYMTKETPVKPVRTTQTFGLDMTEVDKVIDKIIRENL